MATKHKKKKRLRIKKKIRFYLFLFACVLFLALIVTGTVFAIRALVNNAGKRETETDIPQPSLSADADTEPAATDIAVTPAPTPTPAPTMPEPTIQEDWYIARNEALYQQMKTFGSYTSDAEIYEQIEKYQIDPEGKKVAFTFDDGPYSPYTGEVLDVLEKYGVRATFFVKGAYLQMDSNDTYVRRELALGCELGDHTMNHDNLGKIDASEVDSTVKGVIDILEEKYGYTTHLLRPPYISYGDKGSERRQLIVDVCKKYDLAIVNHTRSSHDSYDEYTADMIYERMIAETDELGRGINNSIFLFHDKYQKTVDAIDKIIPVLLERGYQFVTVSELLQCSEEGLHYGWIYSKAD